MLNWQARPSPDPDEQFSTHVYLPDNFTSMEDHDDTFPPLSFSNWDINLVGYQIIENLIQPKEE